MSVARALSIALAQRPAPRGGFHYSNTNYVVLGEVVERVTGRSYAREVRRRLILPLGLTGTRFPATPGRRARPVTWCRHWTTSTPSTRRC